MTKQQDPPCPYCGCQFQPTGSDAQPCIKCRRVLLPLFHPGTGGLEAWTPTDLGRYRLVAVVGRGGMGHVFRGQEKVTGQTVAIKFALEEQQWDPLTQSRFEREINLLQSLTHPNLVRYLDNGTEANRRYYVMEWVEGEDLSKILTVCKAQGGNLPFEHVYQWFQQLCLALQALHNQGIIHRDVKPANIIVSTAGQLTLIDLGIAKFLGAQEIEIVLTRATGAVGTYEYMAPEQLKNARTVDHRADIYSTGIVIYELLTGILPRGRVQPASAINSSVPKWFDDLLFKMMEHEPSARPNVTELLMDLLVFQSGIQSNSIGQPPKYPTPNLTTTTWPTNTQPGDHSPHPTGHTSDVNSSASQLSWFFHSLGGAFVGFIIVFLGSTVGFCSGMTYSRYLYLGANTGWKDWCLGAFVAAFVAGGLADKLASAPKGHVVRPNNEWHGICVTSTAIGGCLTFILGSLGWLGLIIGSMIGAVGGAIYSGPTPPNQQSIRNLDEIKRNVFVGLGMGTVLWLLIGILWLSLSPKFADNRTPQQIEKERVDRVNKNRADAIELILKRMSTTKPK